MSSSLTLTPSGRPVISRIGCGWRVVGTEVVLRRHSHWSGRWELVGDDHRADAWLRRNGLNMAEFAARDAALRAIAAADQMDPIPVGGQRARATLIKKGAVRPNGRQDYVTEDGAADVSCINRNFIIWVKHGSTSECLSGRTVRDCEEQIARSAIYQAALAAAA